MEIRHWHIDPELKAETDAHYRARVHGWVKNKNPLEVIRDVTFDYGARELTIDEVYRFIDYVDRYFLRGKLCGTGIDVGGGPGTFSSIIALRPCVEKMYSVEVSENLVTQLMPVIAEYILGKEHIHKVVGCVGKFDTIELPDNSLDFVFDFFALHHSGNQEKTFAEIYRVLKPGGILVCFDKARDDALSREDLERMLDTEYSDTFKKKMGIDPTVRHTRRMNGEYEYRLKDWKEHIHSAGLKNFEHFSIARTTSNSPLIRFAKSVLILIPPRLQARLTALLPITPTSHISADHRVYTPLVNHFQKEISLMIATK